MNDEVLDHYGVEVEVLQSLVESELSNGDYSSPLWLLRRHGIEREDVTQILIMYLLQQTRKYRKEEAELSTFIKVCTDKVIKNLVRDHMSDKRRVQSFSHVVAIGSNSSEELLNIFGLTEDHSNQLTVKEVEEVLSAVFSNRTIRAYLSHVTEGLTIVECAERYGTTFKVLQVRFDRIRRYLKVYLEDGVTDVRMEAEKRNEVIGTLAAEGFRPSEIADFLNITPQTVRRVCERCGWKLNHAKSRSSHTRKLRAEEISRQAAEGYNVSQIAVRMDIHEMTVRNIAKDYSIQINRHKRKGEEP